jgi:putative cardiolipin synthase
MLPKPSFTAPEQTCDPIATALRRGFAASLLLVLTACASLPAPVLREPSLAIAVTTQTELGRLALQAVHMATTANTTQTSAPARSGLRPMPEANVALDARLTLIRKAQSSLDLQYYLVGDDEIGHLLLRELRDAAQRGVRVRLLVDDFYTTGTDRLLLGLASHPNAEVRLFNPFAGGRSTSLGRAVGLATDFKRLNHRMHNKLFVADGAMAIVGGRNMADGYFLRGPDNFIDFDALALGTVVPQLQTIFDSYWNSPHVYPVAEVASTSETPESLRAHFDRAMSLPGPEHSTRAAVDVYGAPLLSVDIANGLQNLVWGETTAFADNPDKVMRGTSLAELSETALYHSLGAFREARSELMLFSPYFVPGIHGMAGLQEARSHGIPVRVITNSMATTDEPLASLAYERYRIPMLQLGIELYELRPLQGSREARNGIGASRSRWHAKMAFVDRKTTVLGSMNLDQRSATTNTEIVLLIRSPEFAARVLQYFNATRSRDVNHVHQVKLKPDGKSLQWVALKGEGLSEELDTEPDMDTLLRLKLLLLSPFVSEDLL